MAYLGQIPITIIMLTLNEEFHLPGTIENVKEWAEEIFIVDSCSTDRTVDIALEHGVHIVQRPFTNFGDQWNFALDNLPIKTPWTLKLDPDERLSDKLKDSIAKVVAGESECVGYDMIRRLWFMGKPLHVQQPVLRLWRTGKCRFSDVIVNEHPLVDGKVGRVEGLMEHLDSPDLHHWWDKQNQYTTMEAIMRVRGDDLAAKPKFFGSSLERCMYMKKIFFRVPFHYQLLWLYEAFVRGAIWGGSVGRAYIHLRIELFRIIEFKTREMLITGRVPKIPRAHKGDFDQRVLKLPFQKAVSETKKEVLS